MSYGVVFTGKDGGIKLIHDNEKRNFVYLDFMSAVRGYSLVLEQTTEWDESTRATIRIIELEVSIK